MATYFRLRILYKNMSASETLTLNGNHLKTQESFCNLSDLHDLTLIRFTSRSSLGKPFMAEEEEGGGWNSLYNAISGNIILQGLT